jgi:hypothetical protein
MELSRLWFLGSGFFGASMFVVKSVFVSFRAWLFAPPGSVSLPICSLPLPLSLSALSLSLSLSLCKPLTYAARRHFSGTRWDASRGAGRAKTRRHREKKKKRTATAAMTTAQTRHHSLSARRSVVFGFEFRNYEQEGEILSARRIAKRGGARKEGGDGGKGSPLASRRFVVGKIGCFFPLLDSLTMHASNDLGVSLARRIGADCECNVPSRQRPIRAPAGVQDRGEEAGGGRRGQGIFCLLSSLSTPTVPLSSERRLPPFPPPFSSKGELCSLSLTVCKACGISWAPCTPLRGKRERAKQRDREKMAGRREKTGNNGEERRAGVEKRKKRENTLIQFRSSPKCLPDHASRRWPAGSPPRSRHRRRRRLQRSAPLPLPLPLLLLLHRRPPPRMRLQRLTASARLRALDRSQTQAFASLSTATR